MLQPAAASPVSILDIQSNIYSNVGMRWDAQALERGDSPAAASPTAALLPLAGLVRTVSTPEFAGITFHEVTAKSVLNKVVAGSRMPFD